MGRPFFNGDSSFTYGFAWRQGALFNKLDWLDLAFGKKFYCKFKIRKKFSIKREIVIIERFKKDVKVLNGEKIWRKCDVIK